MEAAANIPATPLASLLDQAEIVSVSDVRYDESYQRQPRWQKVNDIAKDFDIETAHVIVCNRRKPRDAKLYCIDGRHRVEAARKVGEPELFAIVHEGMSREREAQLFHDINSNRGPVSAMDRFRSALVSPADSAPGAQARAINVAVEQMGGHIETDAQPGIKAVVALEHIYKREGAFGVQKVLGFIKQTWPDQELQGYIVEGRTLRGVYYLLSNHYAKGSPEEKDKSEMDFKRLQHRLDAMGIQTLNQQAMAMSQAFGGSGWLNWYRAAIQAYNRNLREQTRVEPVA